MVRLHGRGSDAKGGTDLEGEGERIHTRAFLGKSPVRQRNVGDTEVLSISSIKGNRWQSFPTSEI